MWLACQIASNEPPAPVVACTVGVQVHPVSRPSRSISTAVPDRAVATFPSKRTLLWSRADSWLVIVIPAPLADTVWSPGSTTPTALGADEGAGAATIPAPPLLAR